LLKKNIIGLFRNSGWFILSLSLFFVMFFIMQNVNKRFWLHDYEVYYSAANAFIHGGQVYGVAFGLGSGFYKYSPFALLIFAPFAILPFGVAKIIHFVLLSVFIITTIILSANLCSKYFFNQTEKQKNNLLLFLVFLPLLPNVYTELHLGNINIILLFIFIIALRSLLKGENILAGILIAIGILMKPHFLVFIPLLLVRKKFRSCAVIFTGLIIGVMLPMLFTGLTGNVQLHKAWLAIMQAHNNSLISGQDTVYSWVYRAVVQFIYPAATNHDKMSGLLVISAVALLFLAFILHHFKKEKAAGNATAVEQSNFLLEFIVLLAMVPNITVTDSEHFLLSVPLIAFVIASFFSQKESLFIKAVGVFCLVLYGINIREIVGNACASWLTANGITGLANILIILFGIMIYSGWTRKNVPNTKSTFLN